MTERKTEVQKRTLEDNWVELRIVYHRPIEGGPDYHVHGAEAASALAHFACSFAAGIATSQGFGNVADALHRLWRTVQHRAGACICGKQHH